MRRLCTSTQQALLRVTLKAALLCAASGLAWNRSFAEVPRPVQQNDCASALSRLQQKAAKGTANATVLNEVAVCEVRLGHPERATTYFEHVVKIDPGAWQAWNNLGANLLTLNQSSRALSAFNKAIRLDKNVSSVWFNKASALLRLEKDEEAFRSLGEAHQLDSEDVQVEKDWVKVAGLLASRASTLINQEQYRQAQALLSATRQPLRNSAYWNDLIGYAEFKLKEPRPALRHLQKALRLDPNNVDFLLDIGEFLAHYRAYHEAEEFFQVASKRLPDSPKVQFGLAVSYILEDRRNKATSILQQLIAHDREFEPAYHALGECYEDARDSKAMIDLGRRLQLIDRDNPVGWYLIGAGLYQQGLQNPTTLPRAISALQHAVSLNPKSVHSLFTLAQAYEQAGQYSKAIMELKQILQLNPNHGRAHYVLAQIYQRQGKTKLAKLQFEAHSKIAARNTHNDYRMLLTRAER